MIAAFVAATALFAPGIQWDSCEITTPIEAPAEFEQAARTWETRAAQHGINIRFAPATNADVTVEINPALTTHGWGEVTTAKQGGHVRYTKGRVIAQVASVEIFEHELGHVLGLNETGIHTPSVVALVFPQCRA